MDENKNEHNGCGHKNLAILALIHGGGVFPTVYAPELYCQDCSLNISLPTLIPADQRFGQGVTMFGIEMTSELEKDVIQWVSNYSNKVGIGVEEIVSDPKGTYEKASKYEGDLSGLKIVDKEKLEQLSGK